MHKYFFCVRKKMSLKKNYYEIRFGDADAVAELLQRISDKDDIGEILSQGICHTATVFGMEDQAVHVKGMEPAGYDPRVLKGMGLGYATSDRGACHLRATFYKPELAGIIEPDQIEGKAKMFVDFEDRLTLFDAMILCKFFRDIYPWERLGTLIAASTGIDGSQKNLMQIAQSISTKVRDFNIREGMTKAHEQLLAAFHEKLDDSDKVITQNENSILIKEYTALRNWKK